MHSPSGTADAPGELDDLLQSSYELIADATCLLSGFGVVTLMVRTGQMLRNVAICGSDEARDALLGQDMPVEVLETMLRSGERHGLFVFLPADGDYPAELDQYSWIPPIEVSDDPERWHPEDALLAPLLGDDGQLIGALSLDVPLDCRRVAGAEWDRLQVYAEQARNALLLALERVQLVEQLHQLESARDLIRGTIHVGGADDGAGAGDERLEPVLRRVGHTLLSHFGLASAWFHIFGGPGRTALTLDACGPRELPLEHRFAPYGEAIAQRLWAAQELAIIGRTERLNVDEDNTAPLELATAYLQDHELESMLYAPLGMGTECFGLLVLIRSAGTPPWTEVEREAIVEIGRDLGVLVAGVFARQRDEEVLADLRAVEAYKSHLVATVSHELKNPLAALGSNLELLHDTSDPAEAEHLLGAVRRSARRMAEIARDLQSLHSAGSAEFRDIAEVDLGAIVRQVCSLSLDSAVHRGLRLAVSLPTEPVVVTGAPTDLDRLVGNLVGNAVKYSPGGGEVRVALTTVGDEVALSVSDDGIGISAEDQERLFEEFFRSSDAAALAEPGSGLGLAIVRRIVEGHRGRIEVESQPGIGSTFRVWLPREVAR